MPDTPTTAVARRYTLTITCPRPRNRAVDDWHVQPERVASTLAVFVGGEAEMTLTPKTVRLRVSGLKRLPDLTDWHGRMAQVMHSLYLDVQRNARCECQLPSPARTEVRETTPSA